MRKCFFVLFVALLCSSCVSTRAKKELYTVHVTDTKEVSLLPVEDLENEIDIVQLFSGTYDKVSFNMLAYTECNRNKISVVMMNELGIKLGSILYSDDGILLDSKFFSDKIKGEYIIIDFQNAYYKKERLADLYKASGLSFEVVENKDSEIRTIMDGDIVIEEIEKSDGKITIRNYLRNYKYVLTEVIDE